MHCATDKESNDILMKQGYYGLFLMKLETKLEFLKRIHTLWLLLSVTKDLCCCYYYCCLAVLVSAAGRSWHGGHRFPLHLHPGLRHCHITMFNNSNICTQQVKTKAKLSL